MVIPRFFKRRIEKAGLPPGTLVHVGEKKVGKVRIIVIDYDESYFEEREVKSIEDCLPFKDKPNVTWINIDSVNQLDIIEKIGEHFNIHPLVLEDIVNTGQRPKMEDFVDYIFITLKMLHYSDDQKETKAEQVSFLLGSNYVISFQENEGDVFDPIRERIRADKGRIRKMGADYLAYALMDAVVDNYFTILEKLSDRIENFEEELVVNPTPETLQAIHHLKREMIFLRKSVWPLREVINRLERWESSLINKSISIYLSGMLDIYLSSVSNRMNEVMKVLTIIATIFIPLTLIAGIYGMNFRFMPELEMPLGYPIILLSMFFVGMLMVAYFRKKKWL